MAGFGDDNDIQIKVTLDTDEAVRNIQTLKQSIQRTLDLTKSQFLRLAEISKEFNKISIQEVKSREAVELKALANQEAAAKRRHEREMARIALEASKNKLKFESIVQAAAIASAQEVRLAQVAANERKKLAREETRERLKTAEQSVRIAQSNAKKEIELQREKNLKIIQDTAKIYQETTKIKKAPRAELPSDLGGASGAGKLLDALGKSAAGIGVQFGNVNVVVGTLLRNLVGLGGPVGTVTAAFAVLKFGLDKFNASIDETSQAAGKLEGLKTGFETLQRSIGQAPLASINRLREATQGLISDTDLYQRANQAVLLGVPTDTFNEAAAAAVKLGRAMGIDASFGLESLSLGLGRQSRLYLDNLGIVVSAEEAYRNFGLTVGKSAADLSDAEKKAAFFAEALKKIKERADELPDPIDSVAIAQQKANVAQENANQQYLEGFNASKNLAEQYAIQRANTEAAAKSAYIYGAALAELGAVAKSLANGFKTVGVVVSTGFAQALDGTFRLLGIGLSKESKIAILNDEIADTRKRIEYLKTTIPATGELGLIARSNKAEIERLNQSLAEKQKALDGLKVTLNELDGKNVNIKLAIDGIETAQSQITTLFADLGKQAEQEAGIFKIAGLPDVEAAKVFSKYKKAKEDFDNSLNKTKALETYKNALKGIEQQVAGGAIKESAKQLASNIDALAGAVSSGDFKNAKNIFGNIAKGVVDVSKAARSTNISLKDLEAGVNGVNGQIKKNATVNKNAGKDAVKAVKQQEAAWDNFLRKLNRELDTAIDPDIQIKLAEAFRTSEVGSQELIDKLKELGAEVQKRKGDLDALTKEAGDFAEVAQQGGSILGTGQESKAGLKDRQEAQKELADIQAQSANIRSLFTKGGDGGGFFGFDLGEAFTAQQEGALAGAVSDATRLGLNLAFEEFTREDAPDVGRQVGAVIGTAIGASFGGAAGAAVGGQVGGEIGALIGQAIQRNTQDLASTKERKKVDQAFAELFDGERLGLVIEGEIFTATKRRRKNNLGSIVGGAIGVGLSVVLPGISVAVGAAAGAAIDDALNTVGEQAKKKIPPTFVQLSDIVFEGFTRFAGDVRFGSEEASKGFNAFSSYFETLPDDVRASFTGVGLAFGELLGIAGEQARLIGVALANNIGGNLQNLQILVQQTGKSFEELSGSIVKSFLDSQLTIEEAYNSLLQLNNIFEKGIPGVVDYQQAIKNLITTLGEVGDTTAKPGLFGIDSLRDIGTEAIQAGKSFDFIVNQLAQTMQFGANQVQLLFQALQYAGINSLQELENAGEIKLISLLKIIQDIRNGIITTTEQITAIPILPEIKPPSSPRPSGSRGQSPEEKRKEEAKKLREEIQRLLRESAKYEEIVRKITSGELTRAAAGSEIIKLQKEIGDALKLRTSLEKQYEAELNKGRKANKQRLGELAERLDSVNKKIDDLTKQTKSLNLAGVIPFIKSANMLGVVAAQVGVSLQKATDILIKGFLQGRLSLSELNKELDRTKETLGPGIPNAVGAVTDAFQELINAGVQGGQFSVDAFRDIFAEFREKFEKEGSALRQAERKQLEANLRLAQEAFSKALGPEASAAAKKTLDEVKKSLEDFNAVVPVPDLSELRNQLNQAFGPEQVDKFFQALDESGLRSFEDFEKAGVDSIVSILQKLQSLGFNFGQTSQEILDAQQKLREGEKKANAGLDPLQEAINLIKGLNDGAAQLPSVFNGTTAAIQGLNGPLTALRDGFDDILEKLSLLSGQTYENDVVFNVRTVGESGAQALVEILFGDGARTTTNVGGTTSGGGGGGGQAPGASDLQRLRTRLRFLQKKKQTSNVKAEIARVQKRIVDLGG